jgi:hypothetical protein
MKIGLTAAIYINNKEHKFYLDETTKSFQSAKHSLHWFPCENYINPAFAPLKYEFKHAIATVKVLYPKVHECCAHAWNNGIEAAREAGCDYVIGMCTDIVMKSNAIDRLVDFAEAHPEAVMWTMTECPDLETVESCKEEERFDERPHFTCFMVRSDFFKYVGKFDENFIPAYYEDGDMHARLVLGGFKAYGYWGAKFFHYGSRTIKSDPEVKKDISKAKPRNQLYFMEKWGHVMVNDPRLIKNLYFHHPFGKKANPLNYWKPNSGYGKIRGVIHIRAAYMLTIILNHFRKAKLKVVGQD